MKKKTDDFLMANIQIVYQQKKMLHQEQLDELHQLTQWEEIRGYLSQYDYQLPLEQSIAGIDKWYVNELKKLKETMFALNLPEEYVAVLFAKQETFTRLRLTNFQQADAAVLDFYARFIDKKLHPVITQYAKWRIDEFFISDYLRGNKSPKAYEVFLKGALTPKKWQLLVNLPLKEGIEWLKKSDYRDLFLKEKKIVAFEKQMDNFILASLKQYRYQTRGLEGIFTYCVEKNAELFNLRLLLKGRYYHLPTADIKERMRRLNV